MEGNEAVWLVGTAAMKKLPLGHVFYHVIDGTQNFENSDNNNYCCLQKNPESQIFLYNHEISRFRNFKISANQTTRYHMIVIKFDWLSERLSRRLTSEDVLWHS